MSRTIHSNDNKHGTDIVLDAPVKLEWVVKEDPKLQAELNGLPKNGKKVSTRVVNRVVDRIKSL
jgi:hypothetical protein